MLWAEARELLAGFERWSATHEPRATNKAADALANLALDDPAAAARLEAQVPNARPAATRRRRVPHAEALARLVLESIGQ